MRVKLQQLGLDQRAGFVLGDQAADDVGLADIGADEVEIGLRGLVVGRHDVGAGQPAFDHLDVPHVAGKQRGHAPAIVAGHVEDLISDELELLQKLAVVDVAAIFL